MQCTSKKCTFSFHITCGYENGVTFNQSEDENGDIVFNCFCPKHSNDGIVFVLFLYF